MERCRGLYDAERPRHIGVQDGSTGGIEGGAEVGSALKVSEDADELHEVALCGIGIVGGVEFRSAP